MSFLSLVEQIYSLSVISRLLSSPIDFLLPQKTCLLHMKRLYAVVGDSGFFLVFPNLGMIFSRNRMVHPHCPYP